MARPKAKKSKWKNSRQIAGYRSQVMQSMNASKDGFVVLDWKTAQGLLDICDQSIKIERNHEYVMDDIRDA